MADFGQDDEVVSKPSVAAPIAAKSSWGQDDEVISKPKTTALGAGGASAFEAAAATPGVLAGAAMAQKIPQPTWARPVTGIVGGFVGGYFANQGITSLEGVFDKVFGTKVVDTRKAQQEEHPIASTVGSVAGGGLNPFMRPSIPASVKQAAVGGGIMGAAGAAQRAVMGEKVLDPTAVAIDVGVGMFTKPTKLGERILGYGTPTDKPKEAPDTKPPKPTATSTPEEKAAFVKRMDEIKTQRDSVAPLEQAAIRNTETGNIELMGPKHDQARKDAIKGDTTYEEGFVDSRGNFHERQAAVEQAKRSKQIPKDHVLESPEGERPGLHSGDLRKANDPRFAITEDQPAGLPKPPSDEPKTRAEHFKDVTDLEHKLYVEEGKVEGDMHLFSPEELAVKNKELDNMRSQIEDMRKNAPKPVVVDKSNPTPEETHDILAGAKTVGEGLKLIVDGGYGGKGTQWLAKKLGSINRVAESTLTLDFTNAIRPPEGSIPDKEWVGAHYPDSNSTHLYGGGEITTFLHESVHAATHGILYAGVNKSAVALNKLFEHAKSKATPKQLELYGLTDVHEFVSEAYTNKGFIKFLKDIPALEGVKSGNTWGDFKQIIMDMFGATKPEEIKLLDQVLEHGAKVMEAKSNADVTNSKVAFSVKETVDADGVITKEPVVDTTKTSPRDVKSIEEFEQIAADIYEKHGEVDAVKFFEGYKEYQKTWHEPIAETEKFVGTNLRNKAANERIIHNDSADMKAAIPDPARRQAIAEAVDKGDLSGLSKEEQAVAKKYSDLARDIGERAVEKGVVKGLLEDYVTHIIDWAGAPKGAREEFINALFGKGSGGSMAGMTTESKFGKQRVFKTFADLEFFINEANTRIAAAGKSDFRLQIKTKDIAEIYKEYATSMEKAIENKALVDNLKQVRNVLGETLIREVSKENPMPPGWKMMDTPQFAGEAIHPDLEPALKFVFDAGPGDLMKALGMVSQVTKRLNVVGSFFHAKSMMEVMSSAQIPIWTPVKEAIVLPLIEKGVKAITGKELQLSAISKAVDAYRKGGVGGNVDTWIREAGLELKVPEDVSRGVLTATGKFADSMIGKYGPKTRVLEKSMSTVEKYTLGVFDKYTWDYLHTGGKIMVADAYLDRARITAAKEGKPFDEAQQRKEIAKFVNNSFGGLNWFAAATQTQNEFAKRMAMAAYSPEGRRSLQVVLFAPDWTLSTLRAFTDALPKKLNPTKWHPVEGIKGMATPTTSADYARLYQFKTALTYLTLINGINMMTANRPVWENKDPTRIEFPDGTSLQAMKHAMEPYHWIADPAKTLASKLGFIPKALWVGFAETEYASPTAQKIIPEKVTGKPAVDMTIAKAKIIGQSAIPFQAQAAMGAPEGEGVKRALLGTAGFPMYGGTAEQKRIARAERELRAKENAWDNRDKEIESGRKDWSSKHVRDQKALEKQRKKLERDKAKQ